MRKYVLRAASALLVASALAIGIPAYADVFNMPSGQTSLQFVTVGNPGNVADTQVMGDGTTGYGSVPYSYRIGKYDVTAAQYATFLSAVAKSDPYGLYNDLMSNDFQSSFGVNQGIARSGSAGNYAYAVLGNPNAPITDTTWGNAARFANWVQNGQPSAPEGTGTTETGAYTMNGATSSAALLAIARNSGAQFFIPSENEWYKAAYYKGGGTNAGYWKYATQNNSTPSNVLSASGANNANFNVNYPASGYTDPSNYLTSVGAFAASVSAYGTFDQTGDAYQWNEAVIGTNRGSRGASFFDGPGNLSSAVRGVSDPNDEHRNLGFRLAAVAVPEPASITLSLFAFLIGCTFVARRKRTLHCM